jgi:ectoine hydroxylase-related dioxygenase (phytanoyl-CoA dioxygenase family)
MRFDDIMRELGADTFTLSEAQQRQIAEQGYLIIHDVFTPAEVARMRSAAEALVAQLQTDATDHDGHRVQDLIGRPEFDIAWSHPILLAVARHWIGEEFKPMSLNYRNPLPGTGQQDLHSDCTATTYCQAIITLCDVDERNGAPRVVPGSHRWPRLPSADLADTKLPHPLEIKMTGPAGSALFFDGNLWHSGTRNSSDAPRPVLHSGFMCRHSDSWGMEQQRGVILPQTYDRLSKALRNFLDYRVYNPAYSPGPKRVAPLVAKELVTV